MTWHTVVVAADEFQRLLGAVRTAGGVITGSCPCAAGFRVTYVTNESYAMYHEIPSPEEAAELAAWWRQAFETLEPRRASEGFRSS